MKKYISLALTLITALSLFAGCAKTAAPVANGTFDASAEIGVISREDGSGTRGAFVELFGVEVKNAEGKTVDMTTLSAVITNSTAVMMTTVAGDPYAIGYISLGSVNDTIKPLMSDGAAHSSDTSNNGS